MKPIFEKYSDIIEKLEIAFTDVMQEQRALQQFMWRLHWEKSKEGQKQVNYAKGAIARENAYHDANPSDEYLDETKVLNGLPGLARDQRRSKERYFDAALPGTNPWSWQINLQLQSREYADYEARRVVPTHALLRTQQRIVREHNDQVSAIILERVLMKNDMESANRIAAYWGIDQKTLDKMHENAMELVNNTNKIHGRMF